jgi:heparan sulfate-N-deacetylase
MREPALRPVPAAAPWPADREENAVRPTTTRTARSASAGRASDGRSWRRLVVLVVAAALALASVASVASGALAPQPGQRIDLRVLVLGATGNEPTFTAWKAALTREGVPFDAKVADAEGPFTDATFADYGSGHAKYEAVILANGDLVHQVTNPDGSVSFPSALADSEWLALSKFEQTYGIRQISDATFPSPVHGLNAPTNTGEQGGNTGTLTAAGLAAFPYLKGPVPIDNPSPTATDAFGYQATPAAQVAPAAFDTLLAGPNGSSYVGIYTHPDGRQEMVVTVDSNENQLHAQILRHGMLSWVTRGVFLGYQRNYYEMQVDDVFLPDARWSTTLKRSLVDGPTAAPDETQCDPALNTPDNFVAGGGAAVTTPPATTPAGLPACNPIRMKATDVARLITWQNANGIKLDMVFNGSGSDDFKQDTGATTDPLLDAFLANKTAFHWINHTYTHMQLDLATQAELNSEIGTNITWGLSQGLPMDRSELVTGEHSGLHNPLMAGTLDGLGVRWVAADNSREPVPYAIGGATTVPRYPSNVYYNVESQVEQLDEYNYIYLPPPAGKCVNSATNTCRTAPATWAQYVDSEASIMFRHLMANDPRPHFAHQSNLTGDGVLYTVVDELLRRYRAAFSPPLVQLTHAQIGQTLQQQATWAANLAAGRVNGYLQDGLVHVTTTTTMQVPVTGTPQGDVYGGERSGWFTVTPSQPLVQQAPADARTALRAAQTVKAVKAVKAKPLRLTRLRMTPRRFAVSHSRRAARGRRSHAPDGTTVTWVLNQRASMRITIRKVRPHGRTAVVRRLVRDGIQGENTMRITGRVGRRMMRPGRYRLTLTATTHDQRTAPRTIAFTIVRG